MDRLMLNRRSLLQGGAGLLASTSLPGWMGQAHAADTVELPFENGTRRLVKYPQKRPLIVQTSRPPQLETPFAVFNENVLTPNDAFFVRYHLADIPFDIDAETFNLEVKGKVATELKLSLADLKQMPGVDLVAVLQCSGNSRGFFEPRTPGGQLAHGAMGNARWHGVTLKSVLERAGVDASAKQVAFGGADGPVLDKTPDFAKALDIGHAMNGDVMLAWQMNGKDLPLLNGYPLRLIVPGYYGTYWVKHVNEITVLDRMFDGYWMTSAYRVPANDCACTEPGMVAKETVPISKLTVRSLITSVADGGSVKAGSLLLKGLAFDSGDGIAHVDVSLDDGATWRAASLGANLGKFSFRPWQLWINLAVGEHRLKVRATSVSGKTQPMVQPWNPSGYMRSVVETTRVTAA